MNSDESIMIIDCDNYIGRFVEHGLRSLVTPENFHTATGLDQQMPAVTTVVWTPLAPDSRRGEEVAGLITRLRPRHVVMLSSCAVYDATEGSCINELHDVVSDSGTAAAENAVGRACLDNGIALATLRLPLLVVGTGMEGRLMEMVRQIYRGSYFTISDREARVSVIHASSVAEAVAICVTNDVTGTFNINDATDTSVTALAEALSYRIGNKKLYSVADKWARRARRVGDLFGIVGWNSDSYRFKTTTLTFSAQKFIGKTGFAPVSTVEYLKTHDYDENSL